MLGPSLDSLELPSIVRQNIHAAMADRDSYAQKKLSKRPGDADADVSWQAGLSPSTISMINFIEVVVFGTDLDITLKTLSKTR
jgi:hypothetical protein